MNDSRWILLDCLGLRETFVGLLAICLGGGIQGLWFFFKNVQ